MVFTQDDYNDFAKRKKYLSAKLLTFFTEHPLVFIGYGAGDPNIKAILSDIDEALPETGGVIGNVYIIEWRPGTINENPARERLIEIEGAKGVRVKAIETPDFAWPLEAFGTTNFNPKVSAKLLRALMVRSYELVRTDIPRKTVHADFEMLEHAIETSAEFAKLFGISTIADPSVISARYPHILKEVANQIGLKGSTNNALKVLKKVKADKGFDLKGNDNRYHCAVKYSRNIVHKYSDEAITLLKKVVAGEDYEI